MTALPKATEDTILNDRIVSLVKIASKCGHAITVDEITLLIPYRQEPIDITRLIRSDPQLLGDLSTKNGMVVLKGYERLFRERILKETTSKDFLKAAKAFVNELILRLPYAKLIAVGGSVSYNSAVESDDIDLFLVAGKDRLWLSILKVLLLARVFDIKALISREENKFCLSYALEDKKLEEELKRHLSPLLAREFLSIKVLAGSGYYSSLLGKTKWIREMFPRLYDLKLIELKQVKHIILHAEKESMTKTKDILNLLVYTVIRRYLLLKAFLLNKQYRKQRKVSEIFQSRIEKDSLAYTSRRYLELEGMYRSLEVQNAKESM